MDLGRTPQATGTPSAEVSVHSALEGQEEGKVAGAEWGG